MAPQTSIPVSATVLGTIGTVLWCVQLVPQVWTNWRTGSTDGLPGSMMFLWALCGVPFGAYSVVQNFNVPIQVQPQCFMVLCLLSWAQTLVYARGWPAWKAALLAGATAVVFGGVEAALILTIRPLYEDGNETPVLVVGIVASILLAVGLLPPYGEIWKRRGRVIGINWIFLTMDWNGAFFSLMALVAQNTFDVLGGVLYIICCTLETGIFVSHLIWLLRTREVRAAAAAESKTFDDVALEHEQRGVPFRFAERKKEKKSGSEEEKTRVWGWLGGRRRGEDKNNDEVEVDVDVERGARIQQATAPSADDDAGQSSPPPPPSCRANAGGAGSSGDAPVLVLLEK